MKILKFLGIQPTKMLCNNLNINSSEGSHYKSERSEDSPTVFHSVHRKSVESDILRSVVYGFVHRQIAKPIIKIQNDPLPCQSVWWAHITGHNIAQWRYDPSYVPVWTFTLHRFCSILTSQYFKNPLTHPFSTVFNHNRELYHTKWLPSKFRTDQIRDPHTEDRSSLWIPGPDLN